jgi:hypothetical protein
MIEKKSKKRSKEQKSKNRNQRTEIKEQKSKKKAAEKPHSFYVLFAIQIPVLP